MSLGSDKMTQLWQEKMMKEYMKQRGLSQMLTGGAVTAECAKPPTIANLRVEPIENGYIVVYSKPGVAEKRKYAKGLEEVGEVTKAACIELQLTQGK